MEKCNSGQRAQYRSRRTLTLVPERIHSALFIVVLNKMHAPAEEFAAQKTHEVEQAFRIGALKSAANGFVERLVVGVVESQLLQVTFHSPIGLRHESKAGLDAFGCPDRFRPEFFRHEAV